MSYLQRLIAVNIPGTELSRGDGNIKLYKPVGVQRGVCLSVCFCLSASAADGT